MTSISDTPVRNSGADPLLSLHAPRNGAISYGDPHYERCEEAKKTQAVMIAVAPGCTVPLHDGRVLTEGQEVVPERDIAWTVIRVLCDRLVLLQIPEDVAARRAAGVASRHVVGNKGGMLTQKRGVLGPGEAISVEDFDQGPSETAIHSPPKRIGVDPSGNGIYAPGEIIEVRTVTAKEARAAAEKRFEKRVQLGLIIDKGKGA